MSIPAFRIFEEMVAFNLVPCLYRWNLLLSIVCEERNSTKLIGCVRGFLPDESLIRFLVETSDKTPLLLVNQVLNKYEQPLFLSRHPTFTSLSRDCKNTHYGSACFDPHWSVFKVSVCRRSHCLPLSQNPSQQCLFSGCSPSGFLQSVDLFSGSCTD